MNFLDKIKNVKIKEPTLQNIDVENPQSTDSVHEEVPRDSSLVVQPEMDFCHHEEQSSVGVNNVGSVINPNSPKTNSEAETLPTLDASIAEDLPFQSIFDEEKIQFFADSLSDIRSDIMKLLSVSEQQTKILSASHEKDEIIQNMHRELTEYRNNFKQEIMMPMVKSMIRLYDRLAKLSTVYEGKFATEENLPQVCCDFVSEVSGSAEVILSSLAEFDIEKIEPEKGEQFDPRRCRCIKTEPATEQNPANTISCVLKVGFENIVTGRIVDYPEVIVFK